MVSMRFVVISILDALEASSTGCTSLYPEPSRQLLAAHQPLHPLHPRRDVRQSLMLPYLLDQLRVQPVLGIPTKHDRIGVARRLAREPLCPLRLLVSEQVLDDREADTGVRSEPQDMFGVIQRIEEGGNLALVASETAGNESLPRGFVQLGKDLPLASCLCRPRSKPAAGVGGQQTSVKIITYEGTNEGPRLVRESVVHPSLEELGVGLASLSAGEQRLVALRIRLLELLSAGDTGVPRTHALDWKYSHTRRWPTSP